MNRENSGFSLFEILIFFVITFLLILGTAQLTMVSLLSKRDSDRRLKMTELLSAKIEELKSLSFMASPLQEGLYEEHIEDSAGAEIYHRNWFIQKVSNNLFSVEMECFPLHSPEKKIRLIFFLSADLGF